MSIISVVMTDGRAQYIEPAIESLTKHVRGNISRQIIHDDSGDLNYRRWLRRTFDDWEIVTTRGRSGFCGAYAAAFRWLTLNAEESWVFHTEDDFTYETDIDLDVIAAVMARHPYIAQMQLRRQPWGAEPAEGGFVGQWPHFYTDAGDGTHHWLEHRRNWSTNPGLYRRSLCFGGWPDPPGCEGAFGDRLTARSPDLQFALWGRREDPPTVLHIGHERSGGTY